VTTLRRIFWGAGWAVALSLIAIFLIGYAAPYLSPHRFWWTDLFAVVLPAMSVAVGVVCVGMAGQGLYRRRWGRVVVAGVLLLLVTIRFGPHLASWAPVATDSRDLRLMTFNIPPLLDREGSPSGSLVQLLREEGPDVMAVQESRVQTTSGATPDLDRVTPLIERLLRTNLGYSTPHVVPSRMTIQQPVLGRIALDSLSVHSLPPGGSNDARFRYTRTAFTWRGRSAVLYNVHLHTIGQARPWTMVPEAWLSLDRWATFLRTYKEGALRRAQQARLIRRRLKREDHPVIVVGDFNSTPHQWAYRHIAQGLHSALRQRGRGWSRTFPAENPLVQIDHVLAGPEWQITAAHVPTLDGLGSLSDHRPVVAQMRWKIR